MRVTGRACCRRARGQFSPPRDEGIAAQIPSRLAALSRTLDIALAGHGNHGNSSDEGKNPEPARFTTELPAKQIGS